MKVFVDFDNTIVNSSEIVVEMLNNKFGTKKDYSKLKRYDFRDLFPECKSDDVSKCFESRELFKKINPYPMCLKTLNMLNKFSNIELYIVTVGTKDNLFLKEKYLNNFIKLKYNFIGIDSFNSTDKSSVDMSGGIFIDDNINCLMSSNADFKILFKTYEYGEWNNIRTNDDVWVMDNWFDISQTISFLNSNIKKEIF